MLLQSIIADLFPYQHTDVFLKCAKCGWEGTFGIPANPLFGMELIIWDTHPHEVLQQALELPQPVCPFHLKKMQVTKIWGNLVMDYPDYMRVQWKCPEWFLCEHKTVPRKVEMSKHLYTLVAKSVYILRETKAQFKNPCILWSTGKDSTLTLDLCRKAFLGKIPFPVVHIDTGWKFPEIIKFRDELAEKWKFNLVIVKSRSAGKMNPNKGTDPMRCCTTLKTKVLQRTIEKYGFDAVIVSIRRDEHYIRNVERVSSPRDSKFRWNLVEPKPIEAKGQPSAKSPEGDSPFVSLQEPELWDLLQTDFGEDCHHVRRHPILHWTEKDVWQYTLSEGLPFNPLYLQGYRSLGCRTCTVPTAKPTKNIKEIIDQLKGDEREGRTQDKEQIMRKLRSLGYM